MCFVQQLAFFFLVLALVFAVIHYRLVSKMKAEFAALQKDLFEKYDRLVQVISEWQKKV